MFSFARTRRRCATRCVGNFLDWCGVAIPSGVDKDGMPTSLLLSAPHGRDTALLVGRAGGGTAHPCQREFDDEREFFRAFSPDEAGRPYAAATASPWRRSRGRWPNRTARRRTKWWPITRAARAAVAASSSPKALMRKIGSAAAPISPSPESPTPNTSPVGARSPTPCMAMAAAIILQLMHGGRVTRPALPAHGRAARQRQRDEERGLDALQRHRR